MKHLGEQSADDARAADGTFYYRENRPWGSFEQFTDNEVSTVKLIHVAEDRRLSLQRHQKRSEFWRVITGSGTVEIDGVLRDVSVGDEANIPVGSLHRLSGGAGGITVLEIARGIFDENDIERVADDFGRSSDSEDGAQSAPSQAT